MTKQEIVDIVSEATGLTKVETETVMNGIMGTIIESLASNERVELRDVFSLEPRRQKARISRNPKTNEKINTPEKKTILLNQTLVPKTYLQIAFLLIVKWLEIYY